MYLEKRINIFSDSNSTNGCEYVVQSQLSSNNEKQEKQTKKETGPFSFLVNSTAHQTHRVDISQV